MNDHDAIVVLTRSMAMLTDELRKTRAAMKESDDAILDLIHRNIDRTAMRDELAALAERVRILEERAWLLQ